MKNIKLFPKMFIYTFSIMSSLVIISHVLIYLIFPITYLENRKENIKKNADSLISSLNGREKRFIKDSLEIFSKNNDIKILMKDDKMDDIIKLGEKINLDFESDSNTLVIEERKIIAKNNEEITLQFISVNDMQKDAKNMSLMFLPYTLIGSFIFSIILSYIYTKIILHPVKETTQIINDMMELKRDAQLKIRSNDEIGNMKKQINDLYIHLLGVIDDLGKKNKEILALEKKKVDFLRSTSHELKTPMASLKIILENMKYKVGKFKDRDQYIDVSIEIVDKITKMIVEILSLSSYQELKDNIEILNIREEVDKVLDDYKVLIHDKNISINKALNDEEIYMSARGLNKVLKNLISNAIKYSYENGLINIAIKNNQFYIENTCEPLDKEEIEKAFELFTGTLDEKSNGMGLYVVKNILTNYGIEYKFEPSDIGMKFSFNVSKKK